MPEIRNDLPPASGAASTAGDPLGSLYRMSKTAGLASSDYQAVNVCSVLAVVGGLLSFVASFDAVLLIIPLASLVLGIVALVQIRNSNGTQTGMLLAILGIVLSLAVGAWAGSAKYREAARTAADREALKTLVADFDKAIRENRLDDAYNLGSESFQQRVDKPKFAEPWNFYRSRNMLKGVGSTGLFAFESDPATGLSMASGQLIITLNNVERPESRSQIIFSNRGTGWKIEALPDFYPPPGTSGPGN